MEKTLATELNQVKEESIFRNKRYLNLFSGYLTSSLGDQLYYISLPLLVYEMTKSTMASGTMSAVQFLPTTLFGLFIGVFLDKYSRKKFLISGLFIQAVFVLTIPIFLLNGMLPYWVIYLMVFLMSTAALVSTTGFESILPNIVSPDQLIKASGSISLAGTIIRLLGPALAGFLIATFSFTPIFIFISFSFLCYGLIMLKINIPQKHSNNGSILDSLKEGIRFVLKDKVLYPLIAGYLMANIGFGSVVPLLIFTLKDHFHASNYYVGTFFTIAGVAVLIGNTLYMKMHKLLFVGRQMIYTASIITIGFLLMAITKEMFLFFSGYFLVSIGSSWANGNFFYICQKRSPDDFRARTSATTLTMVRVIGPLMALIGGGVASFTGIEVMYYFAGATIIASMVISWKTGLWSLKEIQQATN